MGEYKPNIVIYHDNCADGFAAAWACWMKWGDKCQYMPASYGQTPPDVDGKHVLLVDFSYKRDVLEMMANSAASVVVLDHHKTAQADLQPFQRFADKPERFTMAAVMSMLGDLRGGGYPAICALFDMDRSGARLAWEFCHKVPAPTLVKLVEDRDLWRFAYKDTKPFSLWLRSEPFTFDRFELLAQELDDAEDSDLIIAEGRAMQRFFDAKVNEIASFAKPQPLADAMPMTVNCLPMFSSEVGHALLDKHPDAPFAAMWFEANGKRMWSLRSRDDRTDVSAVAASFGGGGHRNAAGFAVPA